jgi:hypothetical protein
MRGAVLFRSALLYLSVAAICLLSKTAAVAQPGGQSPSGAGEVGHRLLVGYFPQWGLYDDKPYTVKTLVG